MMEYHDVFTRVSNISGILFSLQTALQDPITLQTISSPEFISKFSVPMKTVLESLASHSTLLIGELKTRLNDGHSATRTDHVRIDIQRTLVEFKKNRPNILLETFSGDSLKDSIDLDKSVKAKWNRVLQANFLILGVIELVEEALDFHWALTGMNRDRKLHFNYRHFLPSLIAQHLFCADYLNVFNSWYLGATLVTFLIALTPSLGQTFIALPIQIGSTSIGSLAGYVAVTIFGTRGSVGIVGIGMFFGMPFMYMMLFTRHFVLGLLTLLAYNYYVTFLYTMEGVPGMDTPVVYLYKIIAINSVALSFSLLLTIIIYPNLSRRILRTQLSTLIKSLSAYYTDIILSAFTPPYPSHPQSASSPINHLMTTTQSTAIPEFRISRLRKMQHAISTQFSGLGYLLETSKIEPRTEGPFQADVYESLISKLQRIFDELESARWCVGKTVFDSEVRQVFGCKEVKPWRGEMNQINR
ncbi:UNVERIFIED_CONTAM: hypothetical protein HDU68_007423 [Siphonaria sp. JEL0065]|nr:hypothetical protein HDU68_007423 [Siphonaria sp. JEL0065]